MIVWFDWGEYAIWHLAPTIKVSLDGRRETVYSEAVLAEHRRFFNSEPGADRFLEGTRPDLIWMPKDTPIARQLGAYGWTRVFEGPVSSIFAKVGTSSQSYADPIKTARCFPGP
jgi:hypothetical protein